MFKVAVVGCGGIGNAHARSWSSIEGVKVVAVVDLKPEAAQRVAEGCGAIPLTDISQLPKDLDGVSVVTPPRAHYPVVKALLEAGYNVFSEKPLTTEVETGKELAALAKAQGKVLSVGFKMRYEPVFIKAKELLPQIGKLVSICSTKQQQFNDRPEGQWVKNVGAMYELSIHDFDLISFITGKLPKEVLSSRCEYRFGWPKEDAFHAMVNYGDGVTALLQGMYAKECGFWFKDLTFTFLGDQGYMRVERPDRIIMHTKEFKVVDIPAATKSAFVCELEHFRDAVLGKVENTLKAESAIEMTRLIEDIRNFSK